MSKWSHLIESEDWRIMTHLDLGQTQVVDAEDMTISQSVIFRTYNSFLVTRDMYPKAGEISRTETVPNGINI